MMELHDTPDHNLKDNLVKCKLSEYYSEGIREDFGVGTIMFYNSDPTTLYLVFHISAHLFIVQNIKYHRSGQHQEYRALLIDGYTVLGYVHGLELELEEQSLRRPKYLGILRVYYPEYFL